MSPMTGLRWLLPESRLRERPGGGAINWSLNAADFGLPTMLADEQTSGPPHPEHRLERDAYYRVA
eukprot:CAMPEP_0172739076 /NCGR_PEP_ID=MMETSP1074-20121228/121721_1 /TAXON_ID=2916 /ORGANISM="Ceratium fusus, Strain PA161109" /LENGTH=64 /DNA_ID=CAMNT_0013568859 /DNA_START=1122 /DNA_END=1317 /DNA_ORIENTATION=+